MYGASALARRIDPQDLPEKRAQRLAVPAARVSGALVARGATVAERDVEIAIRSERELTAIVVRLRLLDDEQVPARRRVGDPAVHRELVDVRVAGLVGVVHVDVRPVGRERDPQETLLTGRRRVAPEIEDRATDELPTADGAHQTRLLRDVQRLVAAARGHRGGSSELRDTRELH